MRSSKSRSRSKSNRPRSMGNIVNRVFDSSGPEGKVRGTPQQIIEKYQILARDAQLSNDRVAEQNFFQHAEHYARMLSEAQREMARDQENRRDQPESQNNGGQNNGSQNGGNQNNGGQNGNQNGSSQNNRDRRERDGGAQDADVIDVAEGESGLVDTPEERKTRKPVFRTEEVAAEAAAQEAKSKSSEAATGEADSAAADGDAEKPAEAKPRRARGPRKPRKAAAAPESASEGGDTPPPAAEQSSAAE